MTAALSAQVMAQLAHQIAQASDPAPDGLWGLHELGSGLPGGSAEGLTPVVGAPEAQVAVSLLALLPWLCAHFRYSPHASVAALCLLVCPFESDLNVCKPLGECMPLKQSALAMPLLCCGSCYALPNLLMSC